LSPKATNFKIIFNSVQGHVHCKGQYASFHTKAQTDLLEQKIIAGAGSGTYWVGLR